MKHAYPVMLDVSSRRAVIVGGGAVAARKARGLFEAGCAVIRVVAPSISAEVPAQVERVVGAFEPRHLDGAGLVFAATDSSEVNDAVVAEARRRGILVSRADRDEEQPGDFTNAAVFQEGAVTVAVWAGGSPALAAAIRTNLVSHVERGWVQMADWLAVLRPWLVARADVISIEERRNIFRDLATAEAIGLLASQGVDEVWRWLCARHPVLGIQATPPK